jgi:hypothetical protein
MAVTSHSAGSTSKKPLLSEKHDGLEQTQVAMVVVRDEVRV